MEKQSGWDRTYEVQIDDLKIAAALEDYLPKRCDTLKKARALKRALNLVLDGKVDIRIISWKTETWGREVT